MNSSTTETSASRKGALNPLLLNEVRAFFADMDADSALRSERLKELSAELGGLLWAMIRLPKTASVAAVPSQIDRHRKLHLSV